MTEFEEKIKKYLYDANKMLQSSKSKKLSISFTDDIYTLLSIIQSNHLDVDYDSILKYTTYDFDDSSVEKKFDEYFLHNYNECLDVNNKIGDLGTYLNNLYGEGYYKKYKVPMDMHDTVKICSNFFDFYDKDISNHFKYMLDKHNIFMGGVFLEEGITGCTFSLSSQTEPFIVLNDYKDITLSNILVHEVIHSYLENSFNDKSFENISQKHSNNLDEVYSRFIELVFRLYLDEIRFNENDREALSLSGDNTLIDLLYGYNYMLKNFDSKAILNDPDLYYDYMNYEVYSYGGVLAYHYFDEYLRNPESCKENIGKLSIDSKKHDRKYLLNNYGLKEKNLGKSRVLVKHMKNHFKY